MSDLVNQSQDKLKLIVSGRVVDHSQSLAEQGIKNSSTVMIMLIQDQGVYAVTHIFKKNFFEQFNEICIPSSVNRGVDHRG